MARETVRQINELSNELSGITSVQVCPMSARKKLILIGTLTLSLVLYQNCGVPFEVNPTELQTSSKGGDDILSLNGEMKTNSGTTNRYLHADILKSVFLPSDPAAPERARRETTIDNLVLSQIAAFGAPCIPHDTGSCPGGFGSIETAMAEKMNADVSPIRLGYVTRVCEEVLNMDSTTVQTVLTKAGLTTSSDASADNIQKVFSLFQPARTMPSNAVDSVRLVFTTARERAMTSHEGWRFVINVLCQSSLVGAT